MLKNSLFVCVSIFIISSQLFAHINQTAQDVGLEIVGITSLEHTASDILYGSEELITIASRYHAHDKPRPPKRHYRVSGSSVSFVELVESARELMSISTFATFSDYSLAKGYKTSASYTSSSGTISEYTFVPNDENMYSLLLGLKMGLVYDKYTTYSSFAVDVFSAMEGYFNFETKLGVDIVFPIGNKKFISFVVDPYLSFRLADANVGEITTITTYSTGRTYTYTSDVEISLCWSIIFVPPTTEI